MSMFNRIKKVFGGKKEAVPASEPSTELEPIPLTRPLTPERELSSLREPMQPREPFSSVESVPRPTEERVEISNVRAKLDLLLTEMDSIKTQNQMINERLKTIEKILGEMRGIRYY